MIPTACVLGFGYEAEIAENNSLTVQADVDYYFEGGPAASFGAEYDFKDMVFIRAGYRYGGNSILPSFASVGVGAKFAGIKIDAAYLFANEVIGNTTAISVGYCF
jgi:opacity protein-like surface antigen